MKAHDIKKEAGKPIRKESIIQKEALRELTLQRISQDIFLTADALSFRWSLSLITLAQWRWKGKGPPFFRKGRKILYPLADIEKAEKEGMQNHTM